ncbi:hypothetical protein M1446_02850 [Candidatus Dependentiae bacterium]|nr:hypothetical protein [Candidatus Dependentiae bacterium]
MKKIILIFLILKCFGSEYEKIRQDFILENNRWPNFIAQVVSWFQNNNSQKNDIAYVRFSPNAAICSDEQKFIENRLNSIKPNLENFLNQKIENNLPKIGICFSGGGYRAMISSIGFLTTAKKIGLLDSTLYCSGLSGSTWAIASLYASKKDIFEFKQDLHFITQDGIDAISSSQDLKILLNKFVEKIYYEQIVTPVDIYGDLLSNKLFAEFGDKKFNLTLSKLQENTVAKSYPFPLLTSIITDIEPYRWVEYNPFEAGNEELGYIPMWAFSRYFLAGKSEDNATEIDLGHLLGICGSAFCISIQDACKKTLQNMTTEAKKLPSIVSHTLQNVLNNFYDSAIADIRIFPAMIRNFSYQCSNNIYKDEKFLSIVDAGLDFNLALPPLLRKSRNLDVIIIFDSSAGTIGGELKLADAYAKRKNLKWPKIDFANIDKNLINVFKDETDKTVPTVIYIPLIKNENYSKDFDPQHCIENDYCNTKNFTYSKEQIDQLTGLVDVTLNEVQEIIKQEIKARIKI